MATNRTTPLPRGSSLFALAVLLAGLVLAGRAGSQCAIPYAQKLAAPDPSTNRWFGDVITLAGDVAFIGSQFDDYLCPENALCDAGSVQVFARVAGSWAPAQRLTSSMAEPSEFFGKACAFSGSQALIGAYGHDGHGDIIAGYVYDFRLEGGQWVEHAILEPSDPQGNAWFGWGIAMEGPVAAVAAQCASTSGAVYVFRFSDGEWVEEQKLTLAGTPGNANFGHSVAMEGGRIIVGANNENGEGAAYVFRHDGQSWVQEQRFGPPVGHPGDRFGETVAIRGEFALVGATEEDSGADSSGAVHVYRFDGDLWQHVRRLTPSDPGAEGWFGSSVALGENLAVVGAVGLSDIAENAGQAYAFLYDGTNWSEVARLRPAEVDELDYFGRPVAIQGSEVMIGAHGDDDPCGGGICGAGAVYVFHPLANCNRSDAIDRCEIEGGQVPDCNGNGIPDACEIASGASADCDGNGIPDSCDLAGGGDCNDNGVPDACDIAQGAPDCNGNGLPDSCDPFAPPLGEQKLLAPVPAVADHNGAAVAIFGDVAVTGAPDRDSQGADAGAAYVMRHANGVWANEATLIGGDLTSYDYFGFAVAAERDLVLIGAIAAPTGVSQCGAVYAFRRQAGAWVEVAKLIPPVQLSAMQFGYALAACGDLVIVGAPREFQQRGGAYLYRFDGAAWVYEAKLLPPVPAAGNQFGCSVAIDGDVAVVGERYDDDVNNNAGAAHVFRFDGQSWVHEAKLTDPAGAAFDYLGTSVAVSGDRVAVGAVRGTVSGIAQGTVCVYIHGGPGWTLQRVLTTGTGQELSWFGCSTSIVGSTVLVGAHHADVGPVRSGAAYLFQHDGAQWVPRGQFAPSDIAQGDQVGFAVAFDGQYLSAGAPYENDGADAAGASYFFELPVGPPVISRQPSSLRVVAGARASFTVAAVGEAPLSYRWQRNQQDLADGDGRSGAASPRLVIDAAGQADPGLYRCVVSGGCGSTTSREAILFVDGVLGVGHGPTNPRLEFVGTHPNPFGASTRIEFRAPARGRVRVEIFGLHGELVARLLDQEVAPGLGSVPWTGKSSLGTVVPSGLYVCRISGFGQEERRKLTLFR